MLYLLDASILITAHNSYYPIDRVPEFWEWLLHQGITGKVKIPQEILEEVLEGRAEGDSLLGWLNDCDTKQALSLADESISSFGFSVWSMMDTHLTLLI